MSPGSTTRLAVELEHVGGANADAATVRSLLAHAGLVDPKTRRAPSEALVLGVAGGIGAGYGLCASVPAKGRGSGVGIVARNHEADFVGTFHRNAFERLGVAVDVGESSSEAAAHRKLVAALEAGTPPLVWCGRSLSYDQAEPAWWDAGGTSAWAAVVVGLDPAAGTARVADVAATPMTVPLATLHAARGAVCTHERRMLVVTEAPRLTVARLADAVREGLRDCVGSLRAPRIRGFSLEGLPELARMIPNATNAKGWGKVFPRGRLWWPLADLYRCIETENTGGGLLRPLYADFLDEAARVLRKRALAACPAARRRWPS